MFRPLPQIAGRELAIQQFGAGGGINRAIAAMNIFGKLRTGSVAAHADFIPAIRNGARRRGGRNGLRGRLRSWMGRFHGSVPIQSWFLTRSARLWRICAWASLPVRLASEAHWINAS